MQHPYSIVKEIYHDDLSFTEDEIALIGSKYKKVTFDKGEIVLRADEKVDHQFFVFDGCLRTYLVSKSGKEHTIQFAIKGWWISDYIGYFSETKSVLFIECIEDATLYKISRDDVEEIYTKIPKIEHFIRKKLERSFMSFQKRILANLSQSAKERYLNFTHDYPNIEQHVKNYHIASYLGITTESLSRIRKEISKSNS
ncbi:Crp/Fnr family transcriptional regulator [Kordia sp. YSTF-M3]|uniref:Crp/Fnr family transcriptional regulator n=1 Tax=Kordia aestuariivivens TaxID=2759037 RepID=A0ABR7Q5S5_9FLAO|nr:Crp/Fnr family transcriptional regulator [Kordia aestuariivivens]MBC8753902.1 Crp/Fnr family transcriptional regulator [Kordia aestuariivivens]